MPTAAPMPRPTIANRRNPHLGLHLVRGLVALIGLGVTSAALLAVTVYIALAHDLPRLDAFDRMAGVGVTRFEAADGSLAGERYTERRLALRWDELPRPMILAFLAAEDNRFFEHSGIDFRGIARAMVTNFFSGGLKEGASTITQQLAKVLVGNERSWSRKVKEAILARRMEDLYSKEQILTWYINVIFYGHQSYGVQAAAQNYFRKNVWDLSLAEMAILAGSVQSPSRVNPALDLAAAKERAGHILDNMRDYGWATPEEVADAKRFEYTVYPLRDVWGDQAPDFTEAVRRLGPRWNAADGTGFLERGLTIRMGIDPAAQRDAHAALDDALIDLQKKQGWPGPLARVITEAERDAFFAKNRRWVERALLAPTREPRIGARLLGRVDEVSEKSATIALTPELRGTVALASTAWATAWTVFPKNADGKVDASGRVSFGGKLSALQNALAVGDVVLVEVVALPPPKPTKPTKPSKPPKPTKPTKPTTEKSKKLDTAEPPPEVPAAAPAPPPPTWALELVPVPMMEGALVSTPLEGNGIDALATGWDFDRSEVDRTVALRQTGSIIKPIVYAKAYDLGLPPSASMSGAPYREGGFDPTGPRATDDDLVWIALAKSENPVSLRVHEHVQDRVSPDEWRAWGARLGLPEPLKGNPAEVLGMDQTARGMLAAFATFGRMGRAPELGLVKKVVARDGTVLERHFAPQDPWAALDDAWLALRERARIAAIPVISPTTAYLISENLAAAVQVGTGQKAKSLLREAAGKTGTLDYDVWFAGFTGDRAAVVWLGADRRERTLGPSERLNKVYGSTAALPAWVAFMRAVDKVASKADKRPGIADVVPPDVVSVAIDPVSGLLALPGTGVTIPHRKGTEPTETAPEPTGIDAVESLETEF